MRIIFGACNFTRQADQSVTVNCICGELYLGNSNKFTQVSLAQQMSKTVQTMYLLCISDVWLNSLYIPGYSSRFHPGFDEIYSL